MKRLVEHLYLIQTDQDAELVEFLIQFIAEAKDETDEIKITITGPWL